MNLKRDIVIPPDFQSHEAGLFVAQLDDQSRRLTEDTRGLTPEEDAARAQELLDRIVADVQAHQESPLGTDDQTLIVLKITH